VIPAGQAIDIAQIRQQERALKQKIAQVVRQTLPARRIAQENAARIRLRVAALQERLRETLLEAAEQSYRIGWRASNRSLADARRSFRAEGAAFSAEDVPEIPSEWRRWYEQMTDSALHRYSPRVRRDIEQLTVKAAVEGWSSERLTQEIERVTTVLATWQAERIARTETMRLWNMGNYGRMEEEPADTLIGYEYSVVLDDRVSHYCRPLDGLRVRREELRYIPPLHPHCRTVLEPIFAWDEAGDWGDPNRPQTVPGFGAIPPFMPRRIAPVQSEPVTLPAQTPLPSVSAGYRLPRSGMLRKTAETALAAIDVVHKDGTLPQIPIQSINSQRTSGSFIYDWQKKPVRVSLSRQAPRPELTFIHETGHYLDMAGMGSFGYASQSGAMSGVMDAIHKSATYANILSVFGSESRYGKYLTSPHELWARAYAQYITVRSGDTLLRQQLQQLQQFGKGGQNYLWAWEDQDFEPIAQAIDDLFRRLGWIT
jgi:SPP1 gp7 family putative phage head morphogenesis protein